MNNSPLKPNKLLPPIFRKSSNSPGRWPLYSLRSRRTGQPGGRSWRKGVCLQVRRGYCSYSKKPHIFLYEFTLFSSYFQDFIRLAHHLSWQIFKRKNFNVFWNFTGHFWYQNVAHNFLYKYSYFSKVLLVI